MESDKNNQLDTLDILIHHVVMATQQQSGTMPTQSEVHTHARIADAGHRAYVESMNETLTGSGMFWTLHGPRAPLFAAVRRALSGIGLSDAERWEIVLDEVIRQASEHADAMAREAQL